MLGLTDVEAERVELFLEFDMRHSIDSFSPVVTGISFSQPAVARGLSILTTVSLCPSDFAGIGLAVAGSLNAVRCVRHWIGSPSRSLLDVESDLEELNSAVIGTHGTNGTLELTRPLSRRKADYPQWCALIAISDDDIHPGAALAAGAELLRALHANKQISRAAAQDIERAAKAEPLSSNVLARILNGAVDDEDLTANSWAARLQRSWRHACAIYSATKSGVPPPTFGERARGQILDSSVFARPNRRGGAADHRVLSELQTREALANIKSWIDNDDYRGAFGFLVCCTGQPINMVRDIPLLSARTSEDWIVTIDIGAGCIKTDVTVLTQDAATNPKALNPEAEYIIALPVPQNLAGQWRCRMQLHPTAQSIGDLYPDAGNLESRAPIFNSTAEITPSWARLRRSVGAFLRHHHVDNLLASLITSDYAHIPRSKLYYSRVQPIELQDNVKRFYQVAGLDAPEPMQAYQLAIGSRVVPTADRIQAVDRWLVASLQSELPGKNCSLQRLVEHHNRFVLTVAFRLALVLCLCEHKSLPLCSSLDERTDKWLCVAEKSSPGLEGSHPIPIGLFAARTIASLRAHCEALHARLLKKGASHSALSRWSYRVAQRQETPLLSLATSPNRTRVVGTHDFLSHLPTDLKLAPDFGRKFLENELRARQLPTGVIDGVLRHSVVGQGRNTGSSDFVLHGWIGRAASVIDGVATDLFGAVCHGLAKEVK